MKTAESPACPEKPRISHYMALAKPLLNLLVVLTSAVGFILGSRIAVNWTGLAVVVTGTLLAALAAAVLNQWLERNNDSLMARTKDRPLPLRQIPTTTALGLGLALAVLGIGILALLVNLLAAGLALATLVIYLAIYTPLKTRTPLCTLVGAISGAIPPLIGYAGAAGHLDYAAWTLAALMFVWQIPHFLALAWRHREDYKSGGYRMLPGIDRDGQLNANMLLIYSITLLPLGLAPVLAGLGSRTYFVTSLILGHGLMALAGHHRRCRTLKSTRLIFIASVIYLPLVLGVLTWDHSRSLVPPPPQPAVPFTGQIDSSGLNGFVFDDALVPESEIMFGTGRNSIPALTEPAWIAGSQVEDRNHSGGHGSGKFLVAGERIIGVTINGESRAYPLRILNWHEIINDAISGQPICITYCPLCDSAAVFDRTVDGSVLEFGVSGLLYNSNLLLFDRDAEIPSLWSQLQQRAISGPAAQTGAELALVPSELTYWGDWYTRHPDTTVITGEDRISKRYQRSPYSNYTQTGQLRFPVSPLPPADSLPLMSRLVAVQLADGWRTWVYDTPNQPSPESPVELVNEAMGVRLVLQPRSYGMEPLTLTVTDLTGGELPVLYSFWFAWHAMFPNAAPPDAQLLDAVTR